MHSSLADPNDDYKTNSSVHTKHISMSYKPQTKDQSNSQNTVFELTMIMTRPEDNGLKSNANLKLSKRVAANFNSFLKKSSRTTLDNDST